MLLGMVMLIVPVSEVVVLEPITVGEAKLPLALLNCTENTLPAVTVLFVL